MKKTEIGQLFRRYYDQLTRLAQTMLYDDEEARDVVSEVFAQLVKAGICPRNMEAYLTMSTRNRCLNRIAHKNVRARFEKAYAIEMKQSHDADDMSSASIDQQYQQVMAYARSHLTAQTLLVFQMRHLQGMKYQEIAESLGISRVAVYKHLAKAMTTIKEYQQNKR